MKTIHEVREMMIDKAIEAAKAMGMEITREAAERMVDKAHKDAFGTSIPPKLTVVKNEE